MLVFPIIGQATLDGAVKDVSAVGASDHRPGVFIREEEAVVASLRNGMHE